MPRVHAALRDRGERHLRKRISKPMREAGPSGATHPARKSCDDAAQSGGATCS